MSVSQVDVIDAIGVDKKTGQVVLTITDHLTWSNEHLLVLQEKINSYLAFIESGELVDNYPDAKNREILISIVCKYPPDIAGARFLGKVGGIVEGAGVKMSIQAPAVS